MPPDRWQQHSIIFADRDSARQSAVQRLGPVLAGAQTTGQLTHWWFMNKQPWMLRYLAEKPSPAVETLLSELVGDGVVVSWLPCVYEPETEAFGGAQAMEAAHELFHRDSSHLLAYVPGPGHLGRRETTILLASAMMRGARLDWFEQGDVWAKVAALRPPAASSSTGRVAELAPAMRRLMTADAHDLCRPDGPLHPHDTWVTAFEEAGATLAELAVRGGLTRGLRAVIAHHVIFHANRAGLLLDDQSALSHIAREVIMGTSDIPGSSVGASASAIGVGAVNIDPAITPTADAERLRHALVDRLRALGHTISDKSLGMLGAAQVLGIAPSGGFVAAADPRADGAAYAVG